MDGRASIIICGVEILLTGASGFIGSRLLPQLLTDGHGVRAMTREPARLLGDPGALAGIGDPGTAAGTARIVRADAVTGEGLERALSGVEVAYYLIHSMEPSLAASGHASGASVSRSGGAGFAERELARGGELRRGGAGGRGPPDRLPRRARAALGEHGPPRRGRTFAPPRQPRGRRARAARGRPGLARPARLDRDRRRLTLVPPAGATGRADAGR